MSKSVCAGEPLRLRTLQGNDERHLLEMLFGDASEAICTVLYILSSLH